MPQKRASTCRVKESPAGHNGRNPAGQLSLGGERHAFQGGTARRVNLAADMTAHKEKAAPANRSGPIRIRGVSPSNTTFTARPRSSYRAAAAREDCCYLRRLGGELSEFLR